MPVRASGYLRQVLPGKLHLARLVFVNAGTAAQNFLDASDAEGQVMFYLLRLHSECCG